MQIVRGAYKRRGVMSSEYGNLLLSYILFNLLLLYNMKSTVDLVNTF